MLEVDHRAVVNETAVTEHGVVRLFLCNFRNQCGINSAKAGNQVVIVDIENLALLPDFSRKRDTEIEHNLEEQVFLSSVRLFEASTRFG